jgi:biofilm PGA synthesis N-glycosyltransferase PgaC
MLALISQYRQSRVRWPDYPDEKLPFVSVVLAAYNEEKVIRRTLCELRRSDYPQSKFEVIAVNDGSKDRTSSILEDCAREWPQLRVINQENTGKSSAINNGINHARGDSTVIVTMDADTLFRKATIRLLVRPFVTKTHGNRVGAVAGHVKVGNRRNILTAWQSLEYISGICVVRMAERMLNAISIVPGACSAWSRKALAEIGGFCDDTMAEDCDATLALQRRGYKILQENNAIADTEAPETIRALAKQRKRWTYGNIQALWKHRAMLFRPKYGVLGMIALPYAALSLLVPLLFMPLTLVAAGMSLAAGNWHSIALYAAFVAILHMIISITAVVMARERAWHLLVVPIYRLIYEPLRAYLLYASAYRAIKGTIVQWDKLERRNTVSIFAEPSVRAHPSRSSRPQPAPLFTSSTQSRDPQPRTGRDDGVDAYARSGTGLPESALALSARPMQ